MIKYISGILISINEDQSGSHFINHDACRDFVIWLESLSKEETEDAIWELSGLLSSDDPTERLAGAYALGKFNTCTEYLVDSLIGYASDEDSDVRQAACNSIKAVSSKLTLKHNIKISGYFVSRIQELAMRAKNIEDEGGRASALEAINQFHRNFPVDSVLETTIEMTKDEHFFVRAEASRLLRYHDQQPGVKAAVSSLVSVLDAHQNEQDHEENLVAMVALQSLGAIGREASEAVQAIARRLSAHEPGIRTEAATAIGYIGNAENSTLLILKQIAYNDSNDDCRFHAAYSCGMIGAYRRGSPSNNNSVLLYERERLELAAKPLETQLKTFYVVYKSIYLGTTSYRNTCKALLHHWKEELTRDGFPLSFQSYSKHVADLDGLAALVMRKDTNCSWRNQGKEIEFTGDARTFWKWVDTHLRNHLDSQWFGFTEPIIPANSPFIKKSNID